MSISNSLANQLLNATVSNVAYTPPSSVYVSLYSTIPTVSTTGTEIVGNGYSRQTCTFSTAAAGIAASNVAVNFSCTGNNWPTLVAVGVMDDPTAGNLMYFTGVTGRNVVVGDTLTFDAGTITVTMT